MNAVVAALFNIIIFGTGAAIYLFAVDLIMSTPTLPGWLQVVLVFLCGVVGWLLLRPYRRITQFAGGESAVAALTAEGRRSRALREQRETLATQPGGTDPSTTRADRHPPQRVELRAETTLPPPTPTADPVAPTDPTTPPSIPRRRMPVPSGIGVDRTEHAGRAALCALPAGPARHRRARFRAE